jgi:hypothetical protein
VTVPPLLGQAIVLVITDFGPGVDAVRPDPHFREVHAQRNFFHSGFLLSMYLFSPESISRLVTEKIDFSGSVLRHDFILFPAFD